ncbi:MAG TPA: hypothetical protein VD814_04445 [Nocardioides sp.]|nr:hypothetical protein [Nocardioides sp.]
MGTTQAARAVPEPRLFDALSLLAEVGDELVVRTVRDTHVAWLDRVHGTARRVSGGAPGVGERLHRGIAGGVYGGLGTGLQIASRGLGVAASRNRGPRLDADPRGRFLRAAVNGLIGDRLQAERPSLAIPMAVRRDHADVPLDRASLAATFPEATSRVVVLLHGLCESETAWSLGRERRGTTYPQALAEDGWTPVLLRANTGLPLRDNGTALTGLLADLVAGWPVDVTRIALVGHSLGGLVMRAAAAVAAADDDDGAPRWTDLVTDVVTLGCPHLGSPVASGVGRGSAALALLPESAAFGRILEWRSPGVRDLVEGLGEDLPPLGHARYRLVAATLTRSPRHPVGAFAGDLLVRLPSAYGRSGRRARRRELFPGADTLHVPAADHFALLNHPTVERALREWLA